MLFIVVADLLQTLINKSFVDDIISPPVHFHGHDFPEIQYAGTTLLVLEASISQLAILKDILSSFQAVLVLR